MYSKYLIRKFFALFHGGPQDVSQITKDPKAHLKKKGLGTLV